LHNGAFATPVCRTITEHHLKLLKCANVSWDSCEFGAPAIDCKRPYGNSDVVGDMIDILMGETDENTREKLHETMYEWFESLHKELETVLQIVLVTGEFKTGTYEQKNEYEYRSWVKVSDKTGY
jgi:hypothetical protein